jgi:GGDEF domain-containing protein
MAEKIIFDIQNATVFTSNWEIPLCGISIGISIFPNKFCEEESHSEILKIIYNQADVAMYKAKAKSEQSDAWINSIVLFDE